MPQNSVSLYLSTHLETPKHQVEALRHRTYQLVFGLGNTFVNKKKIEWKVKIVRFMSYQHNIENSVPKSCMIDKYLGYSFKLPF